jgi:hypothetical protein
MKVENFPIIKQISKGAFGDGELKNEFWKKCVWFIFLVVRGSRQEFSENRGFKWPIARAVQIVRPNMTSL